MNDEVTAYISKLDEKWQRDVCQTLRSLIHEADPEIQEAIKWGTPYFEHKGGVAWMFCATEWVHFAFPQGVLLRDPKKLFEEKEDTASKAKRTIKIHEGQEVPKRAIIELIKQAVANNKAGKKVDFKIPKKGEKEFHLPEKYEDLLEKKHVLEAYLSRPYYQQKGYIQWIEEVTKSETREKRIEMMLDELRTGTYMPPKRER